MDQRSSDVDGVPSLLSTAGTTVSSWAARATRTWSGVSSGLLLPFAWSIAAADGERVLTEVLEEEQREEIVRGTAAAINVDEDRVRKLLEMVADYDRHSRAAYSLAYRMMGERQAAEDLVQDALIKVWRSAGGFRSERGSVRTWILSIVHNRGIDQLRSLASRRRTQDRVEQSAPRSQPSEAFAEAWRNRQREQIREALNSLPAEQLKILELAYFSGYTHVEISNLLGLPLGTVKGRMRLGLKKIREYFDQENVAVPR